MTQLRFANFVTALPVMSVCLSTNCQLAKNMQGLNVNEFGTSVVVNLSDLSVKLKCTFGSGCRMK